MATDEYTVPADQTSQITILGVGNILLTDEGVGVRVVERLHGQYTFPDNVQVLDGGVLGMRLMGIIGNTDILIVVDAVKKCSTSTTFWDYTLPALRFRVN